MILSTVNTTNRKNSQIDQEYRCRQRQRNYQTANNQIYLPVYRLNAILLGSLQSSHKDLLAFTRKKQCRSQTFTIPNNPENPPFLHHSLSHLSFTSRIFALKLLYKRLFFLTFSSPFFFFFFSFFGNCLSIRTIEISYTQKYAIMLYTFAFYRICEMHSFRSYY